MTLLLPYEVWRDVEGYEGLYRISARGKVLSFKDKGRGGLLRVGAIKKKFKNSSGYPVVSLCKGNVSKGKRIHRLIAIAFIHNPNNLPEVNHLDGDKCNYEPSNLEWADHENNMRHAWNTGLIDRKKQLLAAQRNARVNFSKKIINTITKDIYPSASFVARKKGINPDTFTWMIRNKKCEYRYL